MSIPVIAREHDAWWASERDAIVRDLRARAEATEGSVRGNSTGIYSPEQVENARRAVVARRALAAQIEALPVPPLTHPGEGPGN